MATKKKAPLTAEEIANAVHELEQNAQIAALTVLVEELQAETIEDDPDTWEAGMKAAIAFIVGNYGLDIQI